MGVSVCEGRGQCRPELTERGREASWMTVKEDFGELWVYVRLFLDLNQHLDSVGAWKTLYMCVSVCVSVSNGLCQKLWQNFEENVWIFLSLSKSDETLWTSGSQRAVEELWWVQLGGSGFNHWWLYRNIQPASLLRVLSYFLLAFLLGNFLSVLTKRQRLFTVNWAEHVSSANRKQKISSVGTKCWNNQHEITLNWSAPFLNLHLIQWKSSVGHVHCVCSYLLSV